MSEWYEKCLYVEQMKRCYPIIQRNRTRFYYAVVHQIGRLRYVMTREVSQFSSLHGARVLYAAVNMLTIDRS